MTLIASGAILMCLIAGMMINVAFGNRPERVAAIGEPLDPVFSLVDQDGKVFASAAFTDKPRVILFGYTGCADICPTMLYALAGNISELGSAAADAMFVFITVDPRRDTPSRLKSYLGEFSSNLVGLTGEPKNVLDVLAAYGVYRNRRADGAIDHSAIALLIDARGILSGRIEENQLGSDVALSKLRRLIAMSGHGATKEKKRSG